MKSKRGLKKGRGYVDQNFTVKIIAIEHITKT